MSLTSVMQELSSRVDSTNLECFPLRTLLCFHKGLGRPGYKRWKCKHSTPIALWSESEPHRLPRKQFLGFQSSIGQRFYRRDKPTKGRRQRGSESNPTLFPGGVNAIKSFRSQRVASICGCWGLSSLPVVYQITVLARSDMLRWPCL